MNKELMIFKNEDFGQVRSIKIEGKDYFVGIDIANALGYKEPRKAISRHCKHGMKHPIGVVTGIKSNGSNALQEIETTVIPEGDMYRLISKSKLPSAEKFEEWVMDEVLPTLRKTGLYSLSNNNSNTELQIIGKNILNQVKELMSETFENMNKNVDKLGEDIQRLEEKQEELETYYKPTHKNKLGYNSFIKSCLGDNATKENCEQAKNQLLFLLGEYEAYQEVPKEVLQNHNTRVLAYDICKNINNSLKVVD